MEHPQATELLPFLWSNRLRGEERVELLRHLTECAECASWAETRSLVASALSTGPAWRDHPSSDLLARAAVGAEWLTRAERDLLSGHLRHCAACRETLDLAGGALGSARGPKAGAGERFLRAGVAPRLARAAALILGLAVLFLLRSAPPSGDSVALEQTSAVSSSASPASPGGDAASPEASAAPLVGAGITTLSGGTLAGTRLVEADRAISAGALQIEAGSDVTFRAGQVVVLAGGFSVDAEASLAIELVAAEPPGTPEEI